MPPPRRDALAESYENLDASEAKRIAAHLVEGDLVQRVRRTRRWLIIGGVLVLLLVGAVVVAVLARTSREALATVTHAVEEHRQLAPVEED